jgi:hypothetical protein
MNMVLSVIFPILESYRSGIQYDAGGPGLIIIGIGFILVIGALIVGLIVGAVKLLKLLRNKKSKDD